MSATVNIDAAAELLGRLVSCPSVSPGRSGRQGMPYGEGAMADLLESIVGPWGAEVRQVEIAPGRVNFIARFGGASSRTLLLEAHADTVPVQGMTIPPFDPVIRDGRLFGRGSCDNKASMAAMLLAIRSVLDRGAGLPATLYFVSTADEEGGATGAHRLMEEGFRADVAVVGEPTGLALVHAHMGAYRCRIVTKGRAAHSSAPERGVNAISKMARVIDAIEGPVREELGRRNHPLFGRPAVSVGVIRGGTQANVVPDRCEIEVDRRTLPGEDRGAVAESFRRQLELLGKSDAEFQYDYEETEWYPAFEADPYRPPLGQVVAAATRVLGRAEVAAVRWASNAGIFHAAGIPCILFGPGDIRQAHTAEEYVELEQVVRAAQVYAEIISAS